MYWSFLWNEWKYAYTYVINNDLTLRAATGFAARVRQQETTALGVQRVTSRYNERRAKEWKKWETRARESWEETEAKPMKTSNISKGSRRIGDAFKGFMILESVAWVFGSCTIVIWSGQVKPKVDSRIVLFEGLVKGLFRFQCSLHEAKTGKSEGPFITREPRKASKWRSPSAKCQKPRLNNEHKISQKVGKAGKKNYAVWLSRQ